MSLSNYVSTTGKYKWIKTTRVISLMGKNRQNEYLHIISLMQEKLECVR